MVLDAQRLERFAIKMTHIRHGEGRLRIRPE